MTSRMRHQQPLEVHHFGEFWSILWLKSLETNRMSDVEITHLGNDSGAILTYSRTKHTTATLISYHHLRVSLLAPLCDHSQGNTLEVYRIYTQTMKTLIWGSDSGAMVPTHALCNGIKYTTADCLPRTGGLGESVWTIQTQRKHHVRDRSNELAMHTMK